MVEDGNFPLINIPLLMLVVEVSAYKAGAGTDESALAVISGY